LCLLRRRRDGLVFERREDAFENPFAIIAAEERFASAFGMRHQAGHIALFIANAGDVLQRAVGIRGVGQVSVGVAVLPQDLIIGLELGERFFVGKIAAFAMGDGHAENFACRNLIGERGVGRGGFEEHVFAAKLQRTIANQGARQQVGFGQDLEAVTDAEDEAAVVGELFDRLHHRTEPGDGPATQVIAITETAGDNDRVGIAERRILVPDEARGVTEMAKRVNRVLIAVGRGELEDGKIHEVVK
jgi:hypothetical protein